MSPKEICTKLSLWIVNFYLKSYIFCFHFTLYLHVWIRIQIQKAPEYGSNTDPDPQHCNLNTAENIRRWRSSQPTTSTPLALASKLATASRFEIAAYQLCRLCNNILCHFTLRPRSVEQSSQSSSGASSNYTRVVTVSAAALYLTKKYLTQKQFKIEDDERIKLDRNK